VDEVLELFLVLIGVAIGLIPEYASLLDEVFEGLPGVSPGPESKLAGGLRGCQGAAPT
jgi:hypothetical protein